MRRRIARGQPCIASAARGSAPPGMHGPLSAAADGMDRAYQRIWKGSPPPASAPAVAACCIIRGLSTRETAAELGMSAAIARRIRERVLTRIEGARAMYDLCRRQLRGEVAS